MKVYVAACIAAIALSGCATTTAEKGVSQESAKTTNASGYSNAELIGLMLGGGKRDEAKLAKRLEAAAAHPLGSKLNPVRVHMPQGQQAYLRRLNCDSGAAPAFNRAGSFGAGP